MHWVRGMHDKLSGKHRRTEDGTLRRRSRRLPAERIVEIVCRNADQARKDRADREAIVEGLREQLNRGPGAP